MTRSLTREIAPESSPTICSPFVTSSWPRTTEGEALPYVNVATDGRSIGRLPTEKELGARIACRKIKLQPKTGADKAYLEKAFGVARWTYNEAVRCLKSSEEAEARKETKLSWKQHLRHLFIKRDSPAVKDRPWLLELGNDIRDAAMRDAVTAHATGVKKVKDKKIARFELSFRSKKRSKSESIELRHRDIRRSESGEIAIHWPNRKVTMELHCSQPEASKFEDPTMDCRFQRTRTGDYYLCIPMTYEGAMAVENQDRDCSSKPLRVCALDPGVRTFQTIYDATESKVIEVGAGDMKRIVRLCMVLDRLISESKSKANDSRRRRHLHKASLHLRERIRSLVDEVHKQLAKFLAANYDLVLIPIFEVSVMVAKRLQRRRKITSKTARQMLTWGHYRFRQRLLHKARVHGSKVAVVNESYTSKTCSCCGNVKWNLGGNKVYDCRRCFAVMDRDANAAKNIFIRNAKGLGIHVMPGFGAYPLPTRESRLQESDGPGSAVGSSS